MGNCCGKTQNRKEEVEMNSPTADMQKVYAYIMEKIEDVCNLKKTSSEVARVLNVPGYLGSFAKIIEYESKSCDRTVLMKICDEEYSKVIGLEAIIDALVEKGWNVNKQNSKGETALFLATRANNLSAIKALLKHNASPNTSDNDRKYNTFHLTALRGYDEATKLLLYYGLETKDIDAQSVDGSTPLILAIRHKNFNVAEMLINKGRANVKLCDNNDTTALHEAARNNALGIVTLLLEDGADVSSKDKNDKTALDLAKEKGHSEIVTVISGALPDNPKKEVQIAIKEKEIEKEKEEIKIDKKPTVEEFISAIENGNYNVVKSLIKRGADVNAKYTYKEEPLVIRPMLHLAAEKGHREIVELLLEKKAKIDGRDEWNGCASSTALCIAAAEGNCEVIELLLRKRADINSQDECNGDTALHIAAREGHCEVITLLLKNKKVNVNIKDECGRTALHNALLSDQINSAKMLIKYGADMNIPDKDGETVLHLACEENQLEIVALLLDKGTDINRKIENRDIKFNIKAQIYNGKTALHVAAREGHCEVEALLLKNKKVNVNIKDERGRTALHSALQRNDVNSAKMLIKHGANVNIPDENGETVLHLACREKQLEIIKILIEKRADVNAYRSCGIRRTPLDYAAGNYEIMELLLKKGAKVDRKDEDGDTALHGAALYGNIDSITLLLDYGANINVKCGRYGKSALHIATNEGYLDAVKILINRGANTYSKDNLDHKPIHIAAIRGHKNVIGFFLSKGVGVNDTNKDGWTPLHYAALIGRLDIAKFLLDKGANVNAKNASGEKPIDIARGKNYQSIVELLSSPYKHTTQSASNPASYLNNVLENNQFAHQSTHEM